VSQIDPNGESEVPAAPPVSRMSVQLVREACGISQRQLAERAGIAQKTLSRIERKEREPTSEEEIYIRAALRTLSPEKAEQALGSHHKARPGIRRAFVCQTCRRRYFLGVEVPAATIPDCPEHGPMVRQANMPYMGQDTEPRPEQGWPPAVDGVEAREEAWARARRRQATLQAENDQ